MKKHYHFLFNTWASIGLVAVFAALSLDLNAQTAPVKQWEKSFGAAAEDRLYALKQTADGGFILGGESASGIGGDKTQASKGQFDFWVVKTNANGNKVWDKTLGGSNNEYFHSLWLNTDGSFILGGNSASPASGDKSQGLQGNDDYWIVKLDLNGNKIWDRSFGGIGQDRLLNLQQTADGGFILGGSSDSGISGDKSQSSIGGRDYWVIKLDANGSKVWDKTYGGNDNDEFSSLQQTSDGGFILGGTSISGVSGSKTQPAQGYGDYWIIKLDPSGNKLWDKTFGGNGGDNFSSVSQTTDGGYILGGSSQSGISIDKSQPTKGSYDFWIIKLDAAGNKQWDKTIGGNSADIFSSIQQTSNGGYILGGLSYSAISGDKTGPALGSSDYWVVSTDASGNKLWDKAFGGSQSDNIYSLQQTSDDGFILGGYTESGISADKSQPSQGSLDYWIIKLGASPTGLKEPETSLSIYPNPATDFLQLPATTTYSQVTVSDLSGKVLLSQSTPAKRLDVSTFSAGIYIISLQQQDKVQHVRIVKK
jgi:hypothetical protein